MKEYTLFQKKKKKNIKEQLGCRYFFFLNAAVLSRKILVKVLDRDSVLADIKYERIRIGIE